MWDFFTKVLETGGLTALIFAIVCLGFGITVKTLWRQNQELHKQLEEARKEYSDALERIQEKRIAEAQAITERFIEHVQSLDRSLDRISNSLSVLIEVAGNGRR